MHPHGQTTRDMLQIVRPSPPFAPSLKLPTVNKIARHRTRIHVCRSTPDANVKRVETRTQHETRSNRNESSSRMLTPSTDDQSSTSPVVAPPPRGPSNVDAGTGARGTGGGFDCGEQDEDFMPLIDEERRRQQGAASAAAFAYPAPGR